MLDWVHRTTADLRPTIPLDTILVEVVPCLKHWFVHATATRDDTNDCAARRGNGFPRARRQANTRPPAVVRVTHHHARGAAGARKASAVSSLLLAHGNNCTLGHLLQGQ